MVSVPIGTACALPYHTVRLTVKRTMQKSASADAAEVQVVEGLGPTWWKSGSRRSSVERREEILNAALSVLAERGYGGQACGRSPDALSVKGDPLRLVRKQAGPVRGAG